jgi:hypothetical protein
VHGCASIYAWEQWPFGLQRRLSLCYVAGGVGEAREYIQWHILCFLFIEYVTAVIIAVCVLRVGFGFYVGGERDDMVATADVLANAFIGLSISPALIDASNRGGVRREYLRS